MLHHLYIIIVAVLNLGRSANLPITTARPYSEDVCGWCGRTIYVGASKFTICLRHKKFVKDMQTCGEFVDEQYCGFGFYEELEKLLSNYPE